MGNPIVHFDIIGTDPDRLRHYYAQLFDWRYNLRAPVPPEVSDPGEYAFIERMTTPDGTGIPGGVGGGEGFESQVLFYVGVEDVEAALTQAESLGGRRVMGPAVNREGGVVVGHFTDPAGNLIDVAAPA